MRMVTMSNRIGTRGRLSSEINVTPMADIMLVLLIIFMITTPLLQSEVSVNLPKAIHPLDAQDQAMPVVVLTREGRIYLGRTQLTEDELYRTLTERLAGEVGKYVFLKADESVSYGRVVHLVDGCRKSGVERLGLMAEKVTGPIPK